jgi:YD repeat-containing protein
MNRLVAETNALGHVTRYVYDPVGNLRQKINANGQTNFCSYNKLELKEGHAARQSFGAVYARDALWQAVFAATPLTWSLPFKRASVSL